MVLTLSCLKGKRYAYFFKGVNNDADDGKLKVIVPVLNYVCEAYGCCIDKHFINFPIVKILVFNALLARKSNLPKVFNGSVAVMAIPTDCSLRNFMHELYLYKNHPRQWDSRELVNDEIYLL